jgi:hypothetical protein
MKLKNEQRKGSKEMKRILFVSFVLFVFLAMVSCMGASHGEKVLSARGTVATYDPGKKITLQSGITGIPQRVGPDTYIAVPPDAPEPVFAYAITPATEVKGTIEPGIRVVIRYTQVGGGDTAARTAVSIEATSSKK